MLTNANFGVYKWSNSEDIGPVPNIFSSKGQSSTADVYLLLNRYGQSRWRGDYLGEIITYRGFIFFYGKNM